MRISFDLDDTLICDASVPTEPGLSWWRRWRYPERLRHGTRSLMTALVRRRCKIWIYTSSCRSPRYLKSWFASFGVPIEGVVNQARHERTVGLRGPSKYPPAFGIDLHVDDSSGVALEGADHRFRGACSHTRRSGLGRAGTERGGRTDQFQLPLEREAARFEPAIRCQANFAGLFGPHIAMGLPNPCLRRRWHQARSSLKASRAS